MYPLGPSFNHPNPNPNHNPLGPSFNHPNPNPNHNPLGPSFNHGNIYLELSSESFTVESLNMSIGNGVFEKTNNFSFVGGVNNRPYRA